MIQNDDLKRLNFFTGFFTTADDWRAEQQYHQRHRQIHNAQLHRPGILPGVGELLLVRQTDPPSTSVEIRPGAAVDSSGAYLCLPQAHTLETKTEDDPDGGTLYIVIRADEVLSEYQNNIQDPDFSGYTRLVDAVEIAVTAELNPERDIELARINWHPASAKPDSKIVDAADPLMPEQNQIDLRYLQCAGPVNLELSIWQEPLLAILQRTQVVFGLVADKFAARAAEDVRHAVVMFQLLVDLRQIGVTHLRAMFESLSNLEDEVAVDIEHKFLNLGKTLIPYKEAVAALQISLDEGEWLHDLFSRQEAVLDSAEESLKINQHQPAARATASVEGEPPVLTLEGGESKVHPGRSIDEYERDTSASDCEPFEG